MSWTNKVSPKTQAAQHCRSCLDFGVCLPQPSCGSFIFIFTQQLGGAALCDGCVIGPSVAKSATKRKIAVAVRIPSNLTLSGGKATRQRAAHDFAYTPPPASLSFAGISHPILVAVFTLVTCRGRPTRTDSATSFFSLSS